MTPSAACIFGVFFLGVGVGVIVAWWAWDKDPVK